jgi:hypothetical protein
VVEIVSEALIGRLADRGADTVCGWPADGINEIMEGPAPAAGPGAVL